MVDYIFQLEHRKVDAVQSNLFDVVHINEADVCCMLLCTMGLKCNIRSEGLAC